MVLFSYGCAVRYATTSDMCRYLKPDRALALKDVPYNPCFEKRIRYFFNIPPSVSRKWLESSTYLRCVGGKVLVCFASSGINCSGRISSAHAPTEALVLYCKRHPNGAVPSSVSGLGTIYAWRCLNGKPVVVGQLFHVDKYGFVKEFWQRMPAQ